MGKDGMVMKRRVEMKDSAVYIEVEKVDEEVKERKV